MLKRRLKAAGLPEIITPHSFRVMVVTDLLGQDVPMEDVQYLAGHSNPQTTQIYDRRRRRVTCNIVERILGLLRAPLARVGVPEQLLRFRTLFAII